MTLANYRYYLGPLVWDASQTGGCWRAPDGVVGMVDLGTLSDCGQAVGDMRPVAFLASDKPLDSSWSLLGEGDCREIAATDKMRDAFQSLVKSRPVGDRLVDLLFSHLTDGSDPDGGVACPPLVPTVTGNLELWLPGHSLVKAERFAWGKHSHTAKLQSLLQRQLKNAQKAAKEGKYKPPKSQTADTEFHRRVLKALCEKYRLQGDDWKQLKPAGWKDSETPLEHSTTITDTFDRANQTGLGTSGEGWAWADTNAGWDIASNKAATPDSASIGRANTTLASADQYAQAVCGGNGYRGPACRCSSSADTEYIGPATNTSPNSWFLQKRVAGTLTSIVGGARGSALTPSTVKLTVSGSSLELFEDGVSKLTSTDTAIAGNLYCGICSGNTVSTQTIDDFEAGDLSPTNPVPVFMHHYAMMRA